MIREGLFATLLLLGTATPAAAAPPEGTVDALGGPTAVADSYIVVLKDTAVPRDAADVDRAAHSLAATYGGGVARTYRHALRGFEARITERAAKRLAADPTVASVTQNHTVRADDTQSPTPSWGLDRVDQRTLPTDNSYTYPNVSPGVRAYVIDTGINLTHTEFAGRVVSGWDFVDNDGDATDCAGHGSHVAGTIGGRSFGVAKNVQLVAVRVLGCNGSGSIAGVIAGIDWVTADHDPGELAVANMSLGGTKSATMENAVTRSIADGVSYSLSAGNGRGADACGQSPAGTPNALTVAATDRTDARAPYSDIGACVDLFAPGTDIVSAWIGGDTATSTVSGTSMAAPHVAGAAALVLADHPTFTPADVAAELLTDSTPDVVTDAGAGTPNKLLHVDPVTAADDFALTAAPTSARTATITATLTKGAAQQVTLTAGGVPAGATATFAPSTIDSAGGTSTLTIATSASTAPGTYTITVVGTGTAATRATTYTLTVDNSPGCVGANSTDTPLPGGNWVEAAVTISGCTGNAAVNSTIEVHIQHGHVDDLEVELQAPDGTDYMLLSRTGEDFDNVDYTFTHDLTSEAANGVWKLRVLDNGPFDSGFFDSWTIDLAGADLPAPACGGASTADSEKFGDMAGAQTTIAVTGCDRAPSRGAYVEYRVIHPWERDLGIYLIAPDGTRYTLQEFWPTGRTDVFRTAIVNVSDKNANGTWTLRAEDASWGTEPGWIDGWKLTL
ncbi:hypothetical protein Val02_51550 [Virgisporangium aliadipatigenens]|uniref:P/Homo B domain-containing protein n=1 Tax=Virgisporangium aliadipatigenens TaxID=741659 RepID=A0A8J3YMJ1_9ACTN|nr:S8 family peptidase [Virgisporangium aliadipatigenens]GIJ48269.1 hypothetical protein Val02_51550 [Virgisporangium aliadipatigenens]